MMVIQAGQYGDSGSQKGMGRGAQTDVGTQLASKLQEMGQFPLLLWSAPRAANS